MPKYFLSRLVCLCLVLAAIVPLVGCDENTKKNIAILGGAISSGMAQTQHAQSLYQRPDWKAEEYFDDPKVINLCNAVRKRDLALIDRLIADGADVNAKGRGEMTPLLWADVQGHPWNKPPSLSQQKQPGFTGRWLEAEYDAVHLTIFTKLLEHGADPNVPAGIFLENGERWYIIQAVASNLPYFEAVMKNGGNPNLTSTYRKGASLLHLVHDAHSLQLLIDAGADPNQTDDDGLPPLMSAGTGEKALILIEAGADWLMASPENPDYLAIIVNRLVWRDVQTPSSMKLIEVLEEKGADFDLEREIIGTPRGKDREVLQQQRRELYERILQERRLQAEE